MWLFFLKFHFYCKFVDFIHLVIYILVDQRVYYEPTASKVSEMLLVLFFVIIRLLYEG